MNRPLISLSIVSHGQAALISRLLEDLHRIAPNNIELILTINLPEDETPFSNMRLPNKILRNRCPKGFGENHNSAFEESRGDFFVVVNPDIRINELNWDALISVMESSKVGAVAPLVLNSSGEVEDSARRFPTLAKLLRRVLLKQRKLDYTWADSPIEVDWVAGMFVMFKSEIFRAIGGFDSRRFFMYYEDVDICKRLKSEGLSVFLQPRASVIHDAQRASHRSIKHLRWHLTSALRYLTRI